ncbi:MAG: PDZ domain-containing protein, partial [Planctomycetota bacterium]
RSAQDVSVFRDLISAYDPGARVAVSVQRTTGVVVVDVLLPARPKSGDEIASYHDYRLEFTVRDCTYDDRRRLFLPSDLTGAFVVDADSGGWSAVGGLRADDVIVQVDGVSITSAADLKRVLAATPTSRRISAFTVQRGISTHIIEIERPAR